MQPSAGEAVQNRTPFSRFLHPLLNRSTPLSPNRHSGVFFSQGLLSSPQLRRGRALKILLQRLSETYQMDLYRDTFLIRGMTLSYLRLPSRHSTISLSQLSFRNPDRDPTVERTPLKYTSPESEDALNPLDPLLLPFRMDG